MKKLIITVLIIYSMLLLGCPAKSIESAKKQSAKLAGYANVGVQVTRVLFNERIISLAQKDGIADGFIVLARGGQAFDAAILRLEATYRDNVPASEIDALFALFDAQVVDRFLDILRELKIISAGNRYGEIIQLITTTVLVIAKAFNKKSQVGLKLKTA